MKMTKAPGGRYQKGFVQGFFAAIGSFFVKAGAYFTSTAGMINLGLTVGLNLLSAHLSRRETSTPRLDDLEYGGSSYDRIIPVVYGEAVVVGNIFIAPPISEDKITRREGGILGIGGTKINYYYYNGSFAAGFCEGPKIIRKIWLDEELVYDTDANSNVILNKHQGLIEIFMGTSNQSPPKLAALDGASWPAHRDLCYVYFHGIPLADYNNRIPAVRALVDDPVWPMTAWSLDEAGTTTALSWRIMPTGPQDIRGSTILGVPVTRVRGAGTGDDSAAIEMIDLLGIKDTWYLEPHNPLNQFDNSAWLTFRAANTTAGWHSDGTSIYIGRTWTGGYGGLYKYNIRSNYVTYEDFGYAPEGVEVGRTFVWCSDIPSTGYPATVFTALNKYDLSYYNNNTVRFSITYGGVLAIDQNDRLYIAIDAVDDNRTSLCTHMDGGGQVTVYASGHQLSKGERVWIYDIADADYADVEGHNVVASVISADVFKVVKTLPTDPAWSGTANVYAGYPNKFIIRRLSPLSQVDGSITIESESWLIEGGDNWVKDDGYKGFIMRWSEDMSALVVRQDVSTAYTSTTPVIMRLDYASGFSYSDSGLLFYSSALPVWYGGDFDRERNIWWNYYGGREVFVFDDNERNAIGINLSDMSKSYPDASYPYGSSSADYIDITDERIGTTSTVATVESLYYHPYYEWLIGHYYTTDTAKVIPLRRTQHEAITLRSIVSSMCVKAGLSTTDFNVNGISASTKVHGMVIDQQQPITSYVGFLSEVFQFSAADVDWRLDFNDYVASITTSIPVGDLRADTRDDSRKPYVAENFLQEQEIPQTVELVYTERETNNLKNTVIARRMDDAINSRDIKNIELGMVVSVNLATQLAHETLQRLWTERSEYDFSLPPKYLGIAPGDSISITDANNAYHTLYANEITLRGDMVIDVRGKSNNVTGYKSFASAVYTSAYATAVVEQPVGLIGDLLDIPALNDADAENVTLYAVVDSWESNHFFGAAIQELIDGVWVTQFTTFNDGTLGLTDGIGNAKTTLGRCGDPWQWDNKNKVEVYLLTNGDTLTSATEEEVYNGKNWALIGDEIIGFKSVKTLSSGHYILYNLLRGLRGTEAETQVAHAIGERFVLLNGNKYYAWGKEDSAIGSTITVRAVPYNSDIETEYFDVSVAGKSLSPWSPVNVSSRTVGNDITFRWTRRDKINNGWQSDSDIGNSEVSSAFNLDIYSSGGTVFYRTLSTNVFSVTYTSAMRAADSTVSVGFTFFRSTIFQLSDKIGRGTPSLYHYASA